MKAMRDIYRLIKFNQYIKNHRIKFALIVAANMLKIRHLFLRLDPVNACNLRCIMCYCSSEQHRKKIYGIFKEDEIDRLAIMFFPKTIQLVIGCGTEPTLYKDFTGIVKKAKDFKIPNVGFVTNGQLLNEQHIQEFIVYGLDELTLSLHGVTKETYERLMVNASYEKLHKVLTSICSLKGKNKSMLPRLRLNYTVNAENLAELSAFFEVYGKYDIHTLQIRPMMDIGGISRDSGLSNVIDKYNRVILSLREMCKGKGIILLANLIDPTYESDNYNSVIIEAVYRRIHPNLVWREDFDWRNETYNEFCKKIKWNQYLIKNIFLSKDELIKRDPFKSSVKYDIT